MLRSARALAIAVAVTSVAMLFAAAGARANDAPLYTVSGASSLCPRSDTAVYGDFMIYSKTPTAPKGQLQPPRQWDRMDVDNQCDGFITITSYKEDGTPMTIAILPYTSEVVSRRQLVAAGLGGLMLQQ